MKTEHLQYENRRCCLPDAADRVIAITPPRAKYCKSIIYFYLFNIADRKSGDFNVFWYLKFKGFKGFQDLEAPVV